MVDPPQSHVSQWLYYIIYIGKKRTALIAHFPLLVLYYGKSNPMALWTSSVSSPLDIFVFINIYIYIFPFVGGLDVEVGWNRLGVHYEVVSFPGQPCFCASPWLITNKVSYYVSSSNGRWLLTLFHAIIRLLLGSLKRLIIITGIGFRLWMS